MSTEDSKPAHCATCGQAASLLETVAALTTANARATAEIASLHGALLQRTVLQNSPAPPALPVIASGSGAGSITVYKQIMAKHGHGRLGRTHMEDVDRLGEPARAELDNYLRRVLHRTVPVGGAWSPLDADQVFATLATFGLKLEDRGLMADATVTADINNHNIATIKRLQNWGRHFYSGKTGQFKAYWDGSAVETLVELARYRGLFNDDGFLTATT